MTFPTFFVGEVSLSSVVVGEFFEVSGSEAHHIVVVRRMVVGEVLQLVDGVGWKVLAKVHEIFSNLVVVLVLECGYEMVVQPALVLVQSLVKAGRDERAVEAAVEIGVDRIIPWQAKRSVVKWEGVKKQRSLEKWRSVVLAAVKQSRRVRVPVVEGLCDTESLVSVLGKPGSLVLVLHESADKKIVDVCVADSVEQVFVVIGPEGGISDYELGLFSEIDANVVCLGRSVLRSSTAAISALSYVSSVLGRWG